MSTQDAKAERVKEIEWRIGQLIEDAWDLGPELHELTTRLEAKDMRGLIREMYELAAAQRDKEMLDKDHVITDVLCLAMIRYLAELLRQAKAGSFSPTSWFSDASQRRVMGCCASGG